MTSRRQFMMTIVPAAAALSVVSTSARADATKLDEKDPQAMGLGYHHDASKVDAKKYPAFKAGSACANCNFFQGKPKDAWGACPLFGGKLVDAKGWCTAYAKKA